MDKLVETAKERFWNREARIRDEWVRNQAARIPKGSQVLDAGAGASKYRPFFSHCQYRTQDFCEYQGELVKYLQPIDYICDITRVPLADATLDVVLCTEVLEHVADPMAVLREFARLLKPGGRLLLTAPQTSPIHMEPYHYYGGFTEYWYRHWLPATGFKVDEIAIQAGPGQAAVDFMLAYYMIWREQEQRLRGLRRLFSFCVRMVVKLPLHYLLSWLLPSFDHFFRQPRLSVGLMVAATRVPAALDLKQA